jgi:hypothetical protein
MVEIDMNEIMLLTSKPTGSNSLKMMNLGLSSVPIASIAQLSSDRKAEVLHCFMLISGCVRAKRSGGGVI